METIEKKMASYFEEINNKKSQEIEEEPKKNMDLKVLKVM